MNLKRLFHNWLHQKSILKQFKYNLRSIRDPNVFDHSPNIRNNIYTEPRWFICDAFVWEETNEGFRFWSHIDALWIQFLKSKYPSLM
jgi:hypothetical protein